MDTRTGAVLAMANAPTFDANRFGNGHAPTVRRNRAVTDMYEPGSTFKIVTIAAALEDGVVTPRTTFVLPPTIQVADRVIHEAHRRGTERMTVRQILAESSNIGTVTVARASRRRASSRRGSSGSASAARPASTTRARAPAWCFRSRSGRVDDRHGPDRAGHRGHADADGQRVRHDRQRRRDADAAPRRADRRQARRRQAASASSRGARPTR